MAMAPDLAPCLAVVGPANSGKTTLLHLLDRALQRHPSQPLAYVVKGTPDGTGRYLFYSPELRDKLKENVKGKWISETSATVSAWIASARAHLDLALLDFGGRHGPRDDDMLRLCTHFLVLARPLETPEKEAESGMESWIQTCARNGLTPVARLRSLWQTGEAALQRGEDGVLEGTFRADATRPEDTANDTMIAALVEELLRARTRRTAPRYLSLKLDHPWKLADLADLGGRAGVLARLAAEQGAVVLGGVAPTWVYAAAMLRALDQRSDARIQIMDPKTAEGLVEIPREVAADPASPLARMLDVRWVRGARGDGVLRVDIRTEDKMLPPDAFRFLASAPVPPEPVPAGPLWISGAVPIWLRLFYVRWLSRQTAGRPLGMWDASARGVVFVHGVDAPRFEERESPYGG